MGVVHAGHDGKNFASRCFLPCGPRRRSCLVIPMPWAQLDRLYELRRISPAGASEVWTDPWAPQRSRSIQCPSLRYCLARSVATILRNFPTAAGGRDQRHRSHPRLHLRGQPRNPNAGARTCNLTGYCNRRNTAKAPALRMPTIVQTTLGHTVSSPYRAMCLWLVSAEWLTRSPTAASAFCPIDFAGMARTPSLTTP